MHFFPSRNWVLDAHFLNSLPAFNEPGMPPLPPVFLAHKQGTLGPFTVILPASNAKVVWAGVRVKILLISNSLPSSLSMENPIWKVFVLIQAARSFCGSQSEQVSIPNSPWIHISAVASCPSVYSFKAWQLCQLLSLVALRLVLVHTSVSKLLHELRY